MDVVIQEDGSVEFVGPTTESQHLDMLNIVDIRNVVLLALTATMAV